MECGCAPVLESFQVRPLLVAWQSDKLQSEFCEILKMYLFGASTHGHLCLAFDW